MKSVSKSEPNGEYTESDIGLFVAEMFGDETFMSQVGFTTAQSSKMKDTAMFQRQKGVETYGTTLGVDTEVDPAQEATQEMVDYINYLVCQAMKLGDDNCPDALNKSLYHSLRSVQLLMSGMEEVGQ